MSRARSSTFALILVLLLWPRMGAAEDSTAIANLAARFHAEHRFSGSLLVARVGSVSKQFTSMLILQLAAEGKLGLQDPLSKFLPDYPADKAGLTIHQLLSHASGLPHYGGIAEIGIDLGDYLRLDRPVSSYVEMIGKLKLLSEPGTEYSYSSMGYIVLAYIAEQVSGQSYGQLIEERIARPLGIEDLGFAYNDRLVERLAAPATSTTSSSVTMAP